MHKNESLVSLINHSGGVVFSIHFLEGIQGKLRYPKGIVCPSACQRAVMVRWMEVQRRRRP